MKNPRDRDLENPEDFFEKKIRPVLVAHCYRCHSSEAKRLKGGLRLDTRQGIRRGGDTGPALVPGKPAESLLIRALRYEGDLEMPPAGKLPGSVIADFERWVARGAVDPRDETGLAKGAAEKVSAGPKPGWAFAPPVASPPPDVRDASWPRGAIDRFILARLEESGLRPAGDADRRTLMRRLYFALVGLPPTSGEIAAFERDASPHALEALVDRLLDSPQFGERWGRHWLDVARYADSTGGGRTRAMVNAWRYRDYVVDAFNSDKPFDRFIREQIAGDLVEAEDDDARRWNLIATGFLVLGPHNYENQDKDRLRMDVVDEQIDTVGRAFLGMTLGCARCHDHKFDPVPTEDYYALAGIFRSTKTLTPGNVSGFVERPLPVEGDLKEKLAERERQVAALEERLAEVAARIPKDQAGPSAKVEELPGVVVDDTAARATGQWKASTSVPRYVGKGYTHDENMGKGRKSVLFLKDLPESGEYEVRLAYSTGTNRASNTPVDVEFAGGKRTVRVDQKRAPPIDGLFVSLGRYPFERGRPAKVTIRTDGTDGYVIADAVQFLSVAELARQAAVERTAARAASSSKSVEEAKAEKKELESRLKKLRAEGPERPMAISVLEEKEPGDWHVHIRGEIRNLGPKVPRGFLRAVRLPASTRVAIPDGESGRRQLAEWIANDANPLTARVIVNRVWHWLFGTGLVRTVDNVGNMGEAPSHPRLLDTLAVEFVRDGWSIKRLIRRIVLSRTYGLTSESSGGTSPADSVESASRLDPENRLLWRAPRRCLEADVLRDAILFSSGELDLRRGGPSIDAAAGKMAGNKVEYGYRYETRRRSLYVPIFRNSLLEIFDVFDFADPNLVVGKRTNTTRATQALYLLNSPFLVEESTRAAERLLEEGEMSDAERVDLAYARILGRSPTAAERDATLAFLEGGGDARGAGEGSAPPGKDSGPRLERWAGFVQVLFSCVDFRYLR